MFCFDKIMMEVGLAEQDDDDSDGLDDKPSIIPGQRISFNGFCRAMQGFPISNTVLVQSWKKQYSP